MVAWHRFFHFLCFVSIIPLFNTERSNRNTVRKLMPNRYCPPDLSFTGCFTCLIDGPVKNLTELTGCALIYGSIVLHGKIVGRMINPILEIRGCLEVIDTNLYELSVNAFSVKCPGREPVVIKQNKNLCIPTESQLHYRTVGLTTGKKNTVSVSYNKCPVCTESTIKKNVSHLDAHNCTTYTSTLVWNVTNPFPNFLQELHGRLIIKNIRIPENLKYDLAIKARPYFQAAVVFINTTEPPDIAILGNKMFQIESDAQIVLQIINISGYRMPKEDFAYLNYKYFPKEVDADFELEKDCYKADGLEAVPHAGYVGCHRMFGLINLVTDVGYHPADIYAMESVRNITLTETDGDLYRVFENVKEVNLFHNAFIDVILRDDICFKSDVMNMIRSWLTDSQQDRIRFKNQNCHKYLGEIKSYDLIWDEGTNMTIIEGTFILESLHSKYNVPKEAGWFTDNDRFVNLETITKPIYINHSVPAVTVEMCGNTIPLPKLLHTVKIQSARDDDLLIKVSGPAYKMRRKEFEGLAEIYGERRLDIDVMQESDCYFPNPIRDLSLLDGCERIVGDFVIQGKLKSQYTTAIIKKISGCIRIINSNIISLNFIKFESPYDPTACKNCSGDNGFAIKNNSFLCLDPSMFDRSIRGISDNKANCDSKRMKEWVQHRNYVILGDYNESAVVNYSEIKEIHGKIVVARTSAKYLDIFSSLETIEYTGTGAAILVEDNPNLVDFRLPELREVRIIGNASAIVFKNNPKLKVSPNHLKELEKISGKFKVLVNNDNNDIDDETYEMLKGIGIGLGSAIAAALLVVFASVLVIAASRKIKKTRRRKEAEKKAEAEMKLKAKLMDAGKNAENRAASFGAGIELGGSFNGICQNEHNGTGENVQGPGGGAIGATAGAYGEKFAEYEEIATDNVSVLGGAKTADPALIGETQFFGNLRDNVSVVGNLRTSKTKNGKGQGSRNSSTMEGAKTANPAKLGRDYDGNLRDNGSLMAKAKGKHNTAMEKDNSSVLDGAKTADPAKLGGKDYDGKPKENASVLGGAKTADPAKLGGKDYDGKPKENASVLGGAKTADPAKLGGKDYDGKPKENASVLGGAKTADPAKLGGKDYDGKPKENASVLGGAKTADPAKLGGKDYDGKPKENASVLGGAKTADPAKLGGKDYDGKPKENASVLGGAKTADPAKLGGKDYDGKPKENASVLGGAKTADPAKLGGKDYDGKPKENASVLGGAKTAEPDELRAKE